MHLGWEGADSYVIRCSLHPLDGKVVGALQPRFAPAIRQMHRLVSEISALSFPLLAKQSYLTSPLIEMCQSLNHLLAPVFILICCTSQSIMTDFSTVT